MLLSGSSSSRCLGRILAWALCAASWFPAAALAQSGDLESTLPEHHFPGLKRLLEGAVKRSPTMLENEIEIALSDARVAIENSPRLPNVWGDVRYDNSQSAVSGVNSRRNRDSGVFYNFQVGQALFHWGALKNAAERARLGVGIAEKNYQEVYRLLALEIRRSFLNLVANKAALQHLRNSHVLKEDDLKLEQDRFSRGAASRGDVFGKEQAVTESALQIQRGETALAAGLRSLSRISGTRLTAEDIPDDVPEIAYSPDLTRALVDALLRDGAQSTFEAQVLQMRVDDAELAYKIARVRLLPRFGINAGHSVENTTNVTGATVDQQGVERQTVTLRADWSIFDGFRTAGEKRMALRSKRLNETRLAHSIERILTEAQQLQDSLTLEANVVRVADNYRVLAQGEIGRVKEEVELNNAAPYAIKQAEEAHLYRIALSASARARLLSEWSALVSLVGADPALKNIPARYVR